MKLSILSLTVFIAVIFKVSQETDSIWTEQTRIDKVIEYEKKLGPESEIPEMNVSLSKGVYPNIDQHSIGKPFIVKRKQTGFLPCYAEYYYSLPDSMLRYVSYDWERDRFGNFFDKQKIWKEESKKLKEYNAEYEKIKSAMKIKFGKPASEDKEPRKEESNSGSGYYLAREAAWETGEYHAELDMVFASMTYRIRLSYYWKN